MKYSKRYIFLTIILVCVFTINFYIYAKDNSTVASFRGADIEETVWNPLVADDVNGKKISVVIDNNEYSNEDYTFYMNDDRNIMIPVSILSDAFDCSAHVYSDLELLVEKHDISAALTLDETKVSVGDETVDIVSPFTEYKGQYYASLNDLSDLLGYSCSFNISDNKAVATDENESTSPVPTKYDLREKGRVSEVKDQGAYGTCWAFAAISALESSLLPEQVVSLSVDNMCMDNSFDVTRSTGGEYTMGMAYLSAWQGPVYESDDPYDDEINTEAQPVKHVQEMQIIDGKDYEGIKEAVFKYGGVQSSLYCSLSRISSSYYDSSTNSYCYIGTDKPNHDVLIIGWDDNYSASNFSADIEGDGAFICQNSWGEDFGDDGVFYVSYYDTNIGTHNVVYTGIEDTDNYDNIYQSDLCGWTGTLGFDDESIYGANVFTAESDEELVAASFYATGADTDYKVYVVKDFKDADSLVDMDKVASGSLEHQGYYTIDFDKAVDVAEGEKYAIVVYLDTPGAKLPMAIEYDSGEAYLDTIDLEDGEGYISRNGFNFIDVKSQENCNLCIKAFSNNK